MSDDEETHEPETHFEVYSCNSEPDLDALRYARDALFVHKVVLGDKLPQDFEAHAAPCENGCCMQVRMTDKANDESYLVASQPLAITQMVAAMQRHDPMEVHPEWARIEARKLTATLN
jgi:hypothetical protein